MDYLTTIIRFCDFRERTRAEVKEKIASFILPQTEKDKMFDYLVEEHYVDDHRFALAFARGKAHTRHWGKTKIVFELRKRGMTADIINNTFAQLEDEEPGIFNDSLLSILQAKKLVEPDPYKRQAKLIRYALSKGFSYDEALRAVRQLQGK